MKFSFQLKQTLVAFALLATGMVSATVAAESVVIVTLDTAHLGAPIPTDFEGLSFETAKVLPRPDGSHYFSPRNGPLVRMFHTLGIRCLRIGGNTADRPGVEIPDDRDVDRLYEFAKAAGVKVIYTVRLRNGNSQADARIVQYIMERYPSQALCFAIGNEPDFYEPDFTAYRDNWTRFMQTIAAAAPTARFCGPSAGKRTPWTRDFAADFAHDGRIMLVTQHYYPGGGGNKVTDPVSGRDELLSRHLLANYMSFYRSFAPAAIGNGMPYRLEEANNYYNGGAKGVSDTFASALWGLDFLYWWAEHDANGINFHTGDTVAAGTNSTVCKYAVFKSSPRGYAAHPLAYAMKAFDLAAPGELVPLTISGVPDPNLTAYAVLGTGNQLYVTLINKEQDPNADGIMVAIRPEQDDFTKGRVMYLTAPHYDIAATHGEALGGSKIGSDGDWKGAWTTLNPPEEDRDSFFVRVPPASAAIVKLIQPSKP